MYIADIAWKLRRNGGVKIEQLYSNARLKYTLTHYVDIVYGKITPEELTDFCPIGGKNPLESVLIWKADLDRAIISLSRMKGWQMALESGMSASMLLQLCRSNDISNMQRTLLNDCILKNCGRECKRTIYPYTEPCWNEGIITRLRKYLNHDGRDEKGRFAVNSADPAHQLRKQIVELNVKEIKER